MEQYKIDFERSLAIELKKQEETYKDIREQQIAGAVKIE